MQFMGRPRFIYLLVVIAAAIPVACPAANAVPRSPAAPLFAAPINATWAANHGARWYEKGFRGFLFEGILGDLTPFPSEREWLKHTQSTTGDIAAEHPGTVDVVPGDWEALVSEITVAVNRLKSNGLAYNFLHINLAPEAPYFTNEAYRELAEKRFRLAGAFCREAGLHGIAVNLQSRSGLYDYRWDGYPPGISDTTLESGARRFSRRILRAFIHAFPEGEILLLAEKPGDSGPLWRPFLAGALDSVGAAAEIPVRLVFRDDAAPRDPQFYRSYGSTFDQWLRTMVSEDTFTRWQRQGGIVYSFAPIHYEQDIPTARHPLAPYRRALYAAALYGRDYVVIAAPEGGWWHIPPDIAEQFSHLRQGGRAAVRFAPPVPQPLDAYAPRLRISESQHLGTWPNNMADAEVLLRDTDAALLVWERRTTPLQTPMRTGIVTMTDIVTGEQTYHTPQDGQVVVPPHSSAHLIEGLPMRAFALPAAMRITCRAPFYAGVTRSEVAFRLYNPLPVSLQGVLALTADARYALGAGSVPVTLAPGESRTLHRTVQGISLLGQRPAFSMMLQSADGLPVFRSAVFAVQPPELFRTVLDGPVLGPPVLLDSDAGNMPTVVAGDRRGGLLQYDVPSTQSVWRMRHRGRHTTPPRVLRDQHGTPYIATQNDHGRFRFLDTQGAEKVVIYPGGSFSGHVTTVHDADTEAILLAAVHDDNEVSVYTPRGRLHARFETAGSVDHIIGASLAPGRLFAIVTATSDDNPPDNTAILTAYTLDGDLAWSVALEDAASAPPIVHAVPQSRRTVVCLGYDTGGISCYDAADGALLYSYSCDNALPTTHLTALHHAGRNPSLLMAQATPISLNLIALETNSDPEAHDADATVRWTLPLQGITALTRLPDGTGLLAGLADGAVHALDRTGSIRWTDHQEPAAVTALAAFRDPTLQENTHVCIIGGQTGTLRGVQIRETLIAHDAP